MTMIVESNVTLEKTCKGTSFSERNYLLFCWRCLCSFCSPGFSKTVIFHTIFPLFLPFCYSSNNNSLEILSYLVLLYLLNHEAPNQDSHFLFPLPWGKLSQLRFQRQMKLTERSICLLLSRFLNFLIPWTNSPLVHRCGSQSDSVLAMLCKEPLAPLVPYALGHDGYAVLGIKSSWVFELSSFTQLNKVPKSR